MRTTGFGTRRRGIAALGAVGLGALVGMMLLASVSPPAAAAAAAGPVTASGTGSLCPGQKLPTPICHVFIVYFENQEVNWTLDHGPAFKYFADTYAFAAQFYSTRHFSYPNYEAATSGHDTNYIHPVNAVNVGDLIEASNVSLTWKAYMQSMPFPCDQNNSPPQYKIDHDPFVEYNDVISNPSYCAKHVVNFTAWDTSESTGVFPSYGFLAPNATDDCWLSSIKPCNAWLDSWLSPIVNSSVFRSSVFFLTFDEGATNDTQGVNGTKGGGHIYTAAVSPYACAGGRSNYDYNAFDLLTTTEWLLNLGRTGVNDSWSVHPPMKDLFCFPPGYVGNPHGPAVSPPGLGETPLLARLTPAPIGRDASATSVRAASRVGA
jgi:hypothetical protein